MEAEEEEEICVTSALFSVIVHYECTQSEIVCCSAIHKVTVIANQTHIQMWLNNKEKEMDNY